MIKYLVISSILVYSLQSQTKIDYPTQVKNKPILLGSPVPGSCPSNQNGSLFVLTGPWTVWVCAAGNYTLTTPNIANLIFGNTTPGSCSGDTAFINRTDNRIYRCNSGTYLALISDYISQVINKPINMFVTIPSTCTSDQLGNIAIDNALFTINICDGAHYQTPPTYANVFFGSSLPSSCSANSLFVLQSAGYFLYTCNAGTYTGIIFSDYITQVLNKPIFLGSTVPSSCTSGQLGNIFFDNATFTTNVCDGANYRIQLHPLHTPSSSSEACVTGTSFDDASFHYVCTATNTLKRVSLVSF